MRPCRECRHQVAESAWMCPQCGAPYPARATWTGWGYEYRSPATLFGLPLVHIAFKYRPNRTPVVARGIIAIGQFGCGVLCIAQFGVGLVSVSQITLAGIALAQVGCAYSLIAQIGIYVHWGYGQVVLPIQRLLSPLFAG